MPSTAPTWRKAALTALAVAKRSIGDVADRGGAEGREGEADADPGQAGAGQPEAEVVGLGAGRAQDHHPGREEEGAGDDHGAVAEAVGELPAGPATTVESAGPGRVASAGAGARV